MAKAVQLGLIQKDASWRMWRRLQADDAMMTGRLYLQEKRLPEGREQFQESARLLDELATTGSESSLPELHLCAHAFLGVVQLQQRQQAKALASFPVDCVSESRRGPTGRRGACPTRPGRERYLGDGLRILKQVRESAPALKQAAVWQRRAMDMALRSQSECAWNRGRWPIRVNSSFCWRRVQKM